MVRGRDGNGQETVGGDRCGRRLAGGSPDRL